MRRRVYRVARHDMRHPPGEMGKWRGTEGRLQLQQCEQQRCRCGSGGGHRPERGRRCRERSRTEQHCGRLRRDHRHPQRHVGDFPHDLASTGQNRGLAFWLRAGGVGEGPVSRAVASSLIPSVFSVSPAVSCSSKVPPTSGVVDPSPPIVGSWSIASPARLVLRAARSFALWRLWRCCDAVGVVREVGRARATSPTPPGK